MTRVALSPCLTFSRTMFECRSNALTRAKIFRLLRQLMSTSLRGILGNLKVPFVSAPTGPTQLHTAYERAGVVCLTRVESYVRKQG